MPNIRGLTFGEKAIRFYKAMVPPKHLPRGTSIINPHANPEAMICTERFFAEYFNDTRNRVFVFGINPGRFGSGATGIPFTDPVALKDSCGIENTFEKRRETSSRFVYSFIEYWEGVRKFYKYFFLTAVSPIGFLRDGVNYNYYDDSRLLVVAKPFIVHSIKQQLAFGTKNDLAIVFGVGKNYRFLTQLNDEYGFFKKLLPLEHPRFIMQYERKHVRKHLEKYRAAFSEAVSTLS